MSTREFSRDRPRSLIRLNETDGQESKRDQKSDVASACPAFELRKLLFRKQETRDVWPAARASQYDKVAPIMAPAHTISEPSNQP